MSKIEWCDETINPIIGCSKISPGCDNCYAEKMACRLAHMGNRDYQDVTGLLINEGVRQRPDNWFQYWNGHTTFRPDELLKPDKWLKPKRIFVGSMGDTFHESVKQEWIHAIFDMCFRNPQHKFIFLTKRPAIMKTRVATVLSKTFDRDFWMFNLLFGTTVENQEQADKRIPELMKMDGCTKFVSVEPMLGPVDLSSWLPNFLDFSYTTHPTRLGWVIFGGESGPHARPMHPEWARTLRDQCSESSTPFFFKQWGEWLHGTQDNGYLAGFRGTWAWAGDGKTAKIVARVGKKKAGRLLDGYTWNELPYE